MNYVQHTRAAHERLRTHPEARPHHVSLYWALFYAWNAAFFDPAGLSLEHEQLMEAARIGNRHTYRAALYELETFGLLTYQPSKSKHQASRCLLQILSGPEVAQVKPPTGARSGPHKNASPGPEVAQALRPEVAPIERSPGAEVAQDTLLYKTVIKTDVQNVGAGTEKKIKEVFLGEGFSEVEVLDDTAPPNGEQPTPGAAPKMPRIKRDVAPKKKGVREATVGTAATAQTTEPRRQRGRPQRPEVPFAESELSTYEAFAEAFAGTDYELADLHFYHAKIHAWRDKKTGLPPTRRDWKATATQFFLNDAHDNRLKLAPGTQRHDPGSSHPTSNPGGGPARSGYVSKWDR